MKQTLFLDLQLFFLFFLNSVHAQSYEWAYRWVNSTQGTDVSVDNQGNVYLISYGNTQTNFNPTNSPGILGVTFGCASVSKLSSTGSLIWVKFISQTGATSGGCTPTQIKVKNGYIYVAGTFGGGGGQFDFDPNNGTAYSSGLNPTLKGFLLKWDLDGNYVWHKLQTTPIGLTIDDLHIDVQGNSYVCGSFANSITANSQSLTSNGSSDAFFTKYDSNGNLIFLQGFGGNQSQSDICKGISTDSNGNVFIGGIYNGAVDFDPSGNSTISTSNGNGDAFVAKFNSSAGFIWVKTFGVNGSNDEVNDIVVDNSNNIYFTGTALNSIDFDFGSATHILNSSFNYSFIVKWDNSGNYIWANGLYSTSGSQGKKMEINNSEIVVLGIGSGTIDMDPSMNTLNLSSSGLYNTVLSRFDLNGNFVYGGILNNNDSNYNRPNGVSVSSNAILIAGDFKGSIDINPDQSSSQILNSLTNSAGSPNSSNFVLKLGVCTTTNSTQNISSCSAYTWPVNNQSYSSSGSYSYTLTNSNGCDSIVVLNLTINPPSNNNINVTTCNSYNWNGNIYTSSGVYNQILNAVNGCDSIVTLNLTIIPQVTNTTNITSCNSYNWNGNIYTSSGVYNQVLSTSNGCDSTVTLNLTITNGPSAVVTSPDGITLNANIIPNATYQWIYCSDLTPVTNQTLSQFIPQINGLYAVVVTNTCGSDTSECANVNTIGLNELDNLEVQIAPNPSNGDIMIQLNQVNEPIHLYISDMQGRILMSDELISLEKTIDLHHFTSGTYFITLEGLGVYQLVKN